MNIMYQTNQTIISTTKRIFLAFWLLYGLSIQCQDGSLDTTFNSTGSQPGVVLTSIGVNGADGFAVSIQENGKIIVGGTDSNNFALARYLTDGSLDSTFNSTGTQPGVVTTTIGTSTTSAVNALVIQANGKTIAAGTDGANFVLARYRTGGLLDTTFNSTGSQPGVVVTTIGTSITSTINAVALQADGKIVVAGTDGANFVLARYLADGSLDTTFNSTGSQPGVVTTTIGSSTSSFVSAVDIQSNGKIVAIGTDGLNFVVARYLTDGSLDTTFNSTGTPPGIVVTSIDNGAFAFAGALQTDGKIVAAGVAFDSSGNQNFALARYLTDGSLDASFGTGGIVVTTIANDRFFSANAMIIQGDGKIVAGGRFTSTIANEVFALARYKHNGSLDTSFGTDGIVTTAIETNAFIAGLALQANGKIVAAGGAAITAGNDSFAIARYLACSC